MSQNKPPADSSGNSNDSFDFSNSSHPKKLSDQEIAKALEDFEDELKDLGADFSPQPESADEPIDPFESELEGILGNKAKAAMLISPLQKADLLAAFCVLADISALCVGDAQGAVALLKNRDGNAPESAAKDITTVVAGLNVVLAVNRADKLEVHLWIDGHEGAEFSPPILFMSVADFVEDYLIGATDLDGLRASGLVFVDSADMSRGEALKIIAKHTKYDSRNPGNGVIE